MISVVTLLATGQLCFAGHVCNYFVKVFKWFEDLPNVLRDKKWFLVKRRKSLQPPTSRTRRQKKPTTANRRRLEAAIDELRKLMPSVYQGSKRSDENLAKFPVDEEVEMDEEEMSPDLSGQVQVERKLFAAWLDEGTHPCAHALMLHASNVQREDMRGAVSGESVFDFCFRSMYQKDVPPTDSPSMGSQDLANFLQWLIEDNQVPNDVADLIQAGAVEDLHSRNKTIQTSKDQEEMWVRWIKQRIHGELESVQKAHAELEQLEGFMSFQKGQQTEGGYSAEAEDAAKELQEQLAGNEEVYYDANEWDDTHEWEDAHEYEEDEWEAWSRNIADLDRQKPSL